MPMPNTRPIPEKTLLMTLYPVSLEAADYSRELPSFDAAKLFIKPPTLGAILMKALPAPIIIFINPITNN